MAEEEELDARVEHVLGSISPAEDLSGEFEDLLREKIREIARMTLASVNRVDFAGSGSRVDLPITIGKSR